MTDICEKCALRTKGICAVLIGTPPDAKVFENRVQGAVPARRYLQKQGDKHGLAKVIRSGWASSIHVMSDGRVTASDVLVPGDFIGEDFLSKAAEVRSIRAMTDVEFCGFDVDFLKELIFSRPDIMEVLIETGVEVARMLRERVRDMGGRDAEGRIVSLMVGLYDRLRERGLLTGEQMPFPLRQQDIADALGLSPVHVNRTLQQLRRLDVISLEGRMLRVANVDRMREMIA
ncbi:MAG: Crp/Fnr family transcriptional regulator [Parvibaculum sp.]